MIRPFLFINSSTLDITRLGAVSSFHTNSKLGHIHMQSKVLMHMALGRGPVFLPFVRGHAVMDTTYCISFTITIYINHRFTYHYHLSKKGRWVPEKIKNG